MIRAIRSARANKTGVAFGAVILANIILAFGPWSVRLSDVGPIAAGFWRLALAFPLLVLMCRVSGQSLPRDRRTLMILATAGVFFALDLAAWHAGIVRTRLVNATLFGNSASFLFVLYGFVIARTLPSRNQVIAIALAAVGIGLLLGRSYEFSPRFLAGDLLAALGGAFFVLYLIAIDRIRANVAPWPVLVIATISAAVVMLPIALAAGETIMPHIWWPLLLLAIGNQFLGQALLIYAMGYLPPLAIGLALLVQPVINAVIGTYRYGETLDGTDLIGIAITALALVLIRVRDPGARGN